MTDQEINEKFKWHLSQAKWHLEQISRLPGMWTKTVSYVLQKNYHKIVDNVTRNNALLRHLLDGRSASGRTTKNARSGGSANRS